MQDLTASVGIGGANKKHDYTLVQTLLRVIKDSKGQPYLAGFIDGVPGDHTNGAIVRYQTDNHLIPPAPGPGPAKAPIPGVIVPTPASATAVAVRAATLTAAAAAKIGRAHV